MNPSPMGGFMEGIAGGVKGATALMTQGNRLKTERETQAANMRMSMGFKFFELLKGNPEAQKNVVGEFILPAFQHFSKQGSVPYSKEQIKNLFGNIDLKNDKAKVFMDSAAKIFKQYEKGELNYKDTLDVFDAAVGTYEGELSGRQEVYLKQKRAQHVAEGRKKEIASLFKSIPGKKKEPSPLMGGLTEGYGPKAAGGIEAAMKADVPFHQATAAFPKKKAPAAPTTPMYKKKQLPGGGTQDMQYNPKTGKHDMPFGKPSEPKEGHFFKLGHNYYRYKGGKAEVIQEGSVDEKAVMNAMKEFGWNMMPEADQVGLVAKHKRILLGQSKPAPKGDTERANAKAAIAAGVNLEAVKTLYKQRTGKEY